MNSPIIIFTYNRIKHLQTLLESLKKNKSFETSKVIVFSDSQKDENEKINIKKIRDHLKKNLISKNTEIIERNSNLGLSKNIISGLNETFNIYDRAIILEDDLELSPYFLEYMNNGLNHFSNFKNVASISGYMYPVNPKKFSNDYFFLKLIESWGWATWKNSWKNFEPDSLKLKNEICKKNLLKEFDLDSGVSYYKMLKDNIEGKNDSWAIRWYASTFLKNMLTLFPNKSYVRNLGMDNTGENCNYTNIYDTELNQKFEKNIKIDYLEVLSDKKVIKKFFKYSKYQRYLEFLTNPKKYQKHIKKTFKKVYFSF